MLFIYNFDKDAGFPAFADSKIARTGILWYTVDNYKEKRAV